MGGKAKQTQRTKNNARPSNSGRSAELLGSTVPSFVGFSAHSGLGIVPVAPGFLLEPLPDNFDSNIEPQFQVVLRKMSKKDPVTKTKALQEFVELVKSSDIATVKAILPLWPKFYHSVANDIEHRVREASQQAQLAVVEVAGKNIAPVLKQLVPVWITSQFDAYAPAANLASQSFKNAFPPNKQKEVFAFCQAEIMDYLVRNLVVHTAATLCNSKVLTEKEIESKYERVVSSNLRGYALYLTKIDQIKALEVKAKHQDILQSKKFWNFAKHDDANVRAAWYECLSSLLQNAPELLADHKQQTIDVVFQHIADTDPGVLPYVWSCVLLVQEVFDDWYNYANFKKVILPKFSLLLKNGGFGNATALCPHYLPFISKLSEGNIQGYSLEEFYDDFFGTIKTWLMSIQQNLTSKSEISANVSAFFECLRYVIQKKSMNKSNGDREVAYSQKLLDDYVNDLITWNVNNDNQISKYLYGEISNCVTSWSQNVNASKVFSALTKSFWNNLATLVQTFETQEAIDKKLDRLIELIGCLTACSQKPAPNRVKFLLDEAAVDKKENNTNKNSVLHAELKPICMNLAKIIISRTINGNNQFITHLKSLCEMFNDIEFYEKISTKEDLYSTLNILKNWLLRDDSSEIIIDIIFGILNHLPGDRRTNYLGDLLKVNSTLVQQWTLQRLLSYPLCLEADTRNLLSQKYVSDIILEIAKETIIENSKEKLNLLQKCFFQNESGDILISKDTVRGIINTVSEPMVNEAYIDMMDTCASFIAQIMPVICSKNSTSDLQREVFLKLFAFSINMNKNNQLSLWEITTCWQDAISSEDIDLDDELITKCTDLIHKRLVNDNLLSEDVLHIAKMASHLLSCSNEVCENDEEKQAKVISFLRIMFQYDIGKNVRKLENYCLYTECLHDKLTPRNIEALEEFDCKDIKTLFTIFYFRLSLMFLLTCDTKPNIKSEFVDQYEDGSIKDDLESADDYREVTEKVIKIWSEEIYEYVLNAMKITAVGSSLANVYDLVNSDVAAIISSMVDTADVFLNDIADEQRTALEKKVLTNVISGDELSAKLLAFFVNCKPYAESENSSVLIYRKSIDSLPVQNSLVHVHILQALLPTLPVRSLPVKIEYFSDDVDILARVATLRAYIENYFSNENNDISDKKVIELCHDLLSEIAARQKSSSEFLLYNKNVSELPFEEVLIAAEIAKLLTEVLTNFPTELTVPHWDFIRIALSSWILMISKAIDSVKLPQVSVFISAVYKLHTAMFQFFVEEKQKSSTVMLTNVIDEWENLFALETSLVLFKSFHSLLSSSDKASIGENIFYDAVCPLMEQLDYGLIFAACQKGFQISLDDCINFLLDKCFNQKHYIRISAVGIFRKLLKHLVKKDSEKLDKRSETVEKVEDDNWHLLCKMHPFLSKYEKAVNEYLQDFSYKLNEVCGLSPVEHEVMMGYLLLWDCVILACSKASAELRSFYAQWITIHQFEQSILQFLIRSMPIEILKNYDSKIVNNDIFKQLDWNQIKDKNLLFERYACHLYTQMLRHLPAVVRKWWNESNVRQKTFVDKLTTNYVSNLLCQEELRAITNKKEKHENMQITVHNSTREVIAVYSIDEAKMELVISLAPNHPLGSAKIESEKQIGGRLQSRVVVRQLTIFLTHQNGSIFDVLSLWKKNLDKKFEGVEECYVCYSVIHQDTCQLPKLSCKTCRKKFHSPCLYKWFTTSSKSTCPICRNVF